MLYRPPTTPAATAVRHVTGQYVAKTKKSKRERAKLAADILDHKVELTDLTASQVAKICGVGVGSVAKARGRTPSATRLLRDWRAADHEARVAFARAVGAERVFDVVTEAVG
jgi:hypothetical protein